MSLQLLYTYNRLVVKVTGPSKTSVLTPSAARIRMAEALADWLDEQELSWGPYLASCFAYHSWSWAPKFERLTLPRYFRHYRETEQEAALWWRQQEIDRQASEPIPLPRGREIIKLRFRREGTEKLCRVQPELTGGFNKLSDHCQTCPEKEACRAEDNDANPRVQRAGPRC